MKKKFLVNGAKTMLLTVSLGRPKQIWTTFSDKSYGKKLLF